MKRKENNDFIYTSFKDVSIVLRVGKDWRKADNQDAFVRERSKLLSVHTSLMLENGEILVP